MSGTSTIGMVKAAPINKHSFCGVCMDELSLMGIGFAVAIFGMACFMATKLASKKAYH